MAAAALARQLAEGGTVSQLVIYSGSLTVNNEKSNGIHHSETTSRHRTHRQTH